MNITERLRLEIFIREQHQKYGDEFYNELSRVLEKIQNENTIDDLRGKPNIRVRWN
jgi:plasmid maintenance system killer protein